MKRRNVYIGMVVIALATSAVFAFFFMNQTRALPTGLQGVINPTGAPQHSMNLFGDFDITLNKPMDVTRTDSFIYVSDTNNKRVSVFDLAGSPLYTFGEEGRGPGQFNFPYGIAADNDQRIYVADMYNGKISIHDDRGDFIEYFALTYSENQTLRAPGGLRIIDEKVYVTDIQSNKVYVFNLDSELLLEIGEPGQEEGQFMAPNAVTADYDGNIYVVDTGNQRVQVFDNEGNFVRIIGVNSAGNSVFVNPRGIGIDARGFVYVVSNLTHLVHGFTKEGEEMFQFGGMGQDNGQLYLPNGLFIDGNDNVYITDTLNLRVSVFN